MNERDDLALELFIGDNYKQSREQSVVDWAWFNENKRFMGRVDCYRSMADAAIAAGYRKPRTITTPEEANALPDRTAFLTPGQIIFRKWQDYYGAGKHAWERELGQMVPAELLSAEGHFPGAVIHEGDGA